MFQNQLNRLFPQKQANSSSGMLAQQLAQSAAPKFGKARMGPQGPQLAPLPDAQTNILSELTGSEISGPAATEQRMQPLPYGNPQGLDQQQRQQSPLELMMSGGFGDPLQMLRQPPNSFFRPNRKF